MPAPVQFGNLIRLNIGSFPTASDQYYPSIAALANGHIAAAWTTASANEVVIARADGVSETAFYLTTRANGIANAGASQVDVAALSDGRAVVVWQNNTVDAAGEINWIYIDEVAGTSAINAIAIAGAQSEAVVAAGTNGRFVTIFSLASAGNGLDVHRAPFTRYGTAEYIQAEVTFGTGVINNQSQPNVAALADGRYIVVYKDADAGGVRGVILDSFGGRPGGAPLVLSDSIPFYGVATQDDAIGVTGLANGGFAISYSPASGTINYRLFDSNGAPTTGLLSLTGSGVAYGQAALGLPDGRLVLVSSTTTFDLVGQIIKPDGSLDGARFTIDNSVNETYHPALTLLPDGRFAVAYSSTGVTGGAGNDIVMKIYDPRETGVTVLGSPDNDEYFGSAYADSMFGGTGNDTLTAGDGADAIYGGAGSDTLSGQGGNDFMTGSWGNDNLNGGAEFDYADYLNAAGSVTVSLLAGTATGADGNDILSGIEGLYGSQYGDTLSGDNAASNALFGNGGADALFGNGGADYIDGGGGDDTLDGGAGDDNLVGGSGLDWVSYYGSTAAVYVDMSGASAFANGTATGFDLLSGIERAYGSIYGDYLFGSALADSLFGDMGSDVIYGFGLGDSLDGGGDTDYIVGGIGADTITTGAGQDYIYFQGQNEGKDTITDWRTDGFDILVIDEPAFGAGLITGQYLSSESWRFVAGTAATGAFGQFLWNGATSTLSWDADGTGAGLAVQLVTLTGITTLAASDILVL